MRFDLCVADCTGDKTNVHYPNHAEINNAGELAAAIAKDNTCGQFKSDYRSNDNFIKCNCIVMDCDNDHTENPDEMITLEGAAGLEPDVAVAVAPSRNNMKPKNGKAPRPKMHCFYPIEETTDAEYVAALKRGIHEKYPFFDVKALDASRFIFGADVDPADIVWHEGWMSIEDVITPVYESEETGTTAAVPTSKAYRSSGMIPVGERNGTLSRYAGALLKRLGVNEYSRDAFLRRAECCEEPLSESELKTIWNSAVKFYRTKVCTQEGYVAPDDYEDDFGKVGSLKPGDYSDIGEAKAFVKEYGEMVRFTTATDYLIYDGKVWNESKQRAVGIMEEFLDMQLADALLLCAVTKQAVIDAGADQAAVESGGKRDIKDFSDEQMKLFMEYLEARAYFAFVMKRRDMKYVTSTLQAAKPMVEINVDELDADPYLLNTPAGTIDLRKGVDSLRPHNPLDYITKITAVSPSDDGRDEWLEQLDRTFLGNDETITYTRQSMGETLFGRVEEEKLTIAYGKGRNGKSTVFNSEAAVMGSYAGTISADILTAGCKRNPKPEIAELKGKRFLIAGELEEGVRLSTSIVKQLCSTDRIKGEKKYKDPFDFIPTHSIVLFTNHLPKVSAMDDGIWRRLVVIPFNAKFEGKNDIKNYTQYLIEHSGGYILKWMIEGAKEAYEKDFDIEKPKEVREAIAKYKADCDWFSHFLEECCEVDPDYEEKSGDFYAAYRAYCARTGDLTRSTTEFYTEVENRGFTRQKRKDGRFVKGLKLAEDGGDFV